MTTDPLARQHASNVQRWFAEHNLPAFFLFGLQPDRCLFLLGGDIIHWCEANMDPWTCGIRRHKPSGYVTAVRGWRERRATNAVQIIEHHDDDLFCEIDFDGYNPAWGLAPALGHLAHLILRHKTNPRTVARKRGYPLITAKSIKESEAV